MQVFDKMTAILLAVVLCFLGPAGLTIERQEAMAELAVMGATVSRMEQWKQRGYITSHSYDALLQELAALGEWQVELEYRQRVVEPDLTARETTSGYLSLPQKEIERILREDGWLRMHRGDTLEMVVYPATPSQRAGLLGQLLEKSQGNVIRYGGIVTGEWDENRPYGGDDSGVIYYHRDVLDLESAGAGERSDPAG